MIERDSAYNNEKADISKKLGVNCLTDQEIRMLYIDTKK